MFLHIDCNAFFASCEVATNPTLVGKPVVVANDNEAGGGIVLALTAEAKALGIKRGQPLFQIRKLLEQNHVTTCPADHKKYRAISQQIMQTVKDQEIVLNFVQYSIDEFFGWLPIDDPLEVEYYTRKVKDLITEKTGIPVGCGCSQTYTLAKVATHFAKRYAGYNGICVITPDKRERALAKLPIADVWGIGRKIREKLISMGINTALDFAKRDEHEIMTRFNSSAVKTYKELNGFSCIEIERSELQRSIMQSHTFAFMLTEKKDLEQQVRGFAQRCCIRLREQQGLCNQVTLFIATNRHRSDLKQYSNSATIKLISPSSDTPTITKTAIALLDSLYRPGYQYKQAGVILGNIVSVTGSQLDLFTSREDERHRKLMSVADSINKRFGDKTISFGDTHPTK